MDQENGEQGRKKKGKRMKTQLHFLSNLLTLNINYAEKIVWIRRLLYGEPIGMYMYEGVI